MLSKETLQKIEQQYKIPGLVAAHEAPEETAVELPEINVLTDEELTRVKNTEYANGKTKGTEMDIKAFKDETGLEFTGKSLKALAEAISKKAVEDAKIAPDKKVEALQKDLDTVKNEYETLKTTLSQKEQLAEQAKAEKELYKALPTLGENAPDVSVVVDVMRAKGYDFKLENGELVPYKDGEPVKDKLATVIPVKDVITGFAKEARLIPDTPVVVAGRGGSDSKQPVYTKLSELKADFEKSGKSTMGQEFLDKAMELKTANENFDMSA